MPAFCSRRCPAWSTLELLGLLGLWGEEAVQSQLRSSHRNFDTYGLIASGMQEKGRERDTQQCREKIKELRQVYQKTMEANCCSAALLKTCCFYKKLHAILGGDFTARSPVVTLWGLETVDIGANPKDEVVDGDVELKEDVEHMTVFGGVASQGLFLTPEGSNQSQHLDSRVHEAGGVSSDVPLRTHSSALAECLCQIRQRTRRSKEDMFHEVLQSTDTVHSETIVWRETINE